MVLTYVLADKAFFDFKGKKNLGVGMNALSNSWWNRLDSTLAYLARHFATCSLGYEVLASRFEDEKF